MKAGEERRSDNLRINQEALPPCFNKVAAETKDDRGTLGTAATQSVELLANPNRFSVPSMQSTCPKPQLSAPTFHLLLLNVAVNISHLEEISVLLA